MKQLIAAALLTLAGPALQAQDAATPDWGGINLAVTDQHVLPAYTRFAEAAATLVPASASLCAAPAPDALAALQESYHLAFDAWQGIAHVQFGPVTYFNWNYRLQFWPDDNGTGARQIDALLAAQDVAQLQAATFERQSVGVQGFPALERLLFEDDSLAQLQAQPFRCQLVQAIAANLATIADGIAQRWSGEFRAVIADPAQSGQFENAQDATVDFYKALVESVRRYQQQKLVPVLGESLQQVRERRAESWRSQRSLRNLKLDVAALQHLFATGTPALSSALLTEDVVVIDAAFAALQATLAPLPDDFAPLLSDADGYAQLTTVVAQLDALYEALEAALKRTDLYLGFNSLDGD
jgi:predicted lipoprotein